LFVLQVIPKNLNPVWNQTFHFFVANAVQDMLIVEVWDKDTFGKVLPSPQISLPAVNTTRNLVCSSFAAA
jgi:Ca2+-dependent lipid-binding protein